MGLDVYLRVPGTVVRRPPRIYIRDNGKNREISREEWEQLHPDREPVYAPADERDVVYSDNITHNLGVMACEAGLYDALWRPEEFGYRKAEDLIKTLQEGLQRLRDEPERYRRFNPDNGWGDYETLLKFVENYLRACEAQPEANVSVWR